MTAMTMIEDIEGNINWECSARKALISDKNGFEDKTKKCPKCGVKINAFYSLYDEDGNYADWHTD